MVRFVVGRLVVLLLTVFCLTLIVFVLTNIDSNLRKIAVIEGSNRMTAEQIDSWLVKNGYDQPTLTRYGQWLGVLPYWYPEPESGVNSRCKLSENKDVQPKYCGVLQGYWGYSSRFKEPVADILVTRFKATGILIMWVMITMVPLALVIGVLAGMRERSATDRVLSSFAIITTATPEYVSGVLLIVLFASSKTGLSPLLLDKGTLLKGSATSALDVGINVQNFALPVIAIAFYGMGYIARMTRASMIDVMTQKYIYVARLKGLPFYIIVLRHALRNALITPFTVIMLQFAWLLTGVVIVEVLFNYKGFGWTVVEAASNNDIELLLGCSVIAVVVVLTTQLISDIGYVYLNPRIRVH